MDGQLWRGFAGKRVLLLQGPMGPFFANVADALRGAGAAAVHKINFNGGDWLFYRTEAVSYRGSLAHWPAFLSAYLKEHRIDVLMLFGDCRPLHRAALELADNAGLASWVFEEGYIRPNYVTFEPHGVNGFSRIPTDPAHYERYSSAPAPAEQEVGQVFGVAAKLAMQYFTISTLAKPWFPHAVHHRSLNMLEGLIWCRGYYRKLRYQSKQKKLLPFFTGEASNRFFLVPLQTAGDSQVRTHSCFDSVTQFIEQVVASFAEKAPADTLLVIKHHPMDRAYHDYSRLLRRLAAVHGLQDRLFYVHDLHLPTLLNHARGVVVINSTVGLSALHHQTPVITLGRAVYNIAGLTYQGQLADFWSQAADHVPDLDLYWRFRNYVVEHTQINGSFYKPLPGADQSGLLSRVKTFRHGMPAKSAAPAVQVRLDP